MLDPTYRKPPTLHLAALLGLATTVIGLLAEPSVLALLPAKWATAIATVGAIVQAFSRAIHDGTPKVDS